MGSVKSGAKPDCVTEVLTELVRELELGGAGWVKEYTDQIATMTIIGMAIFSHVLRPCRFLVADALSWTFVLSFFFDDIHAPANISRSESRRLSFLSDPMCV